MENGKVLQIIVALILGAAYAVGVFYVAVVFTWAAGGGLAFDIEGFVNLVIIAAILYLPARTIHFFTRRRFDTFARTFGSMCLIVASVALLVILGMSYISQDSIPKKDLTGFKRDDREIRSNIENLRSYAIGFYKSNNSYAGLGACFSAPDAVTCGGADRARATQYTREDLLRLSEGTISSLKANVTDTSFCVSHPLKSDASSFVCADARGLFMDTQCGVAAQCER